MKVETDIQQENTCIIVYNYRGNIVMNVGYFFEHVARKMLCGTEVGIWKIKKLK